MAKLFQRPFRLQSLGMVGSSSGKKTSSRITGAITVDITTNNTTCGYYNGSIIALASGGTPPYKYILSDIYETRPPHNTGNFPNLLANEYLLKVIDANNASEEIPVTLTNDLGSITLEAETVNPGDCNKLSASIKLTATGGQAPYEYSSDFVNW